MIVYVESNFVLEIALGQEDAASVEAILRLAEDAKLNLAFPAFSLSEPFGTITHRGRERLRLCNALTEQLRQLKRSQPHQQILPVLEPVPGMLSGVERREVDLLESTIMRLLAIGHSIATDEFAFQQALLYEDRYGLSPQDAIIYATVILDATTRNRTIPKYFISRNWKDFGVPDIMAELRKYGCRYVESFESGLTLISQKRRIEAPLASPSGSRRSRKKPSPSASTSRMKQTRVPVANPMTALRQNLDVEPQL